MGLFPALTAVTIIQVMHELKSTELNTTRKSPFYHTLV